MRRKKNNFSRRDFVKNSAFITGAATGASLLSGANPELEARAQETPNEDERTTAIAQCPYCGVGCAITYHVQGDKIVRAEGRASRFVLGWLRGALLETEADWDAAEKLTEGLPEADTSGTVVQFDWTGLASGTDYSVAVRAYDDSDLLSPLTAPLAVAPGVSPAAVTDLASPSQEVDWLQLA